VGVVAVDTPAGEDALGEPVLTGPPDVDHDLVLPVLDQRRPDAGGDGVERLVPGDPLPPPLAPLPGALQGVQDPVRVGELVDRGGALGAVAAPGARMLRISLELAHLEAVAVDVGQEAAGRFAVEAGGGHQHVAVLDPLGP
jgi:hypothetical protein